MSEDEHVVKLAFVCYKEAQEYADLEDLFYNVAINTIEQFFFSSTASLHFHFHPPLASGQVYFNLAQPISDKTDHRLKLVYTLHALLHNILHSALHTFTQHILVVVVVVCSQMTPFMVCLFVCFFNKQLLQPGNNKQR